MCDDYRQWRLASHSPSRNISPVPCARAPCSDPVETPDSQPTPHFDFPIDPEPRRRLNNLESIGDTGFQLVRQYDPAFYLKVTAEEYGLKYVIQRPRKADIQGKFDIVLDANGGIGIFRGNEMITFEEASRELIGPAIGDALLDG